MLPPYCEILREKNPCAFNCSNELTDFWCCNLCLVYDMPYEYKTVTFVTGVIMGGI